MRFGFRRHFSKQHSLKWHMTLLLLMAGVAGFLCSRALLQLGWESVIGRYPVAVLAGYACFLLSVRIWLQWLRWQYSEAQLAAFEVEPSERPAQRSDKVLDWLDLPFDADGLGCLIIAALLVVLVLIGGAWWLIADAGILLTDIAVQFLFAGWLTRRLHHLSNAHWLRSLVGATFWPLLWSLLAVIVLAVVIHFVCPEATTLRAAFASSCHA